MIANGKNDPTVVIRLGHLGDVVLTTGVLSHWHEQDGSRFVFITRKGNGPVLDGHPAVSEVIEMDTATLKTRAWFDESRRLAGQYRGCRLIDLHGTLRSRILSALWKGPVRRYPKLGLVRRMYDKTHAERFRAILEATNVPQRYAMALDTTAPAQSALLPRILLTDDERSAAEAFLDGLPKDRPLVALHPYATHPAKQWPRAAWEHLTAMLAGAGMAWFVVGRDDEPIFPDHPRDYTNRTNLRETCGLLARADLLITGDSGPMHLASGVGTPVVALFGPTAKVWGFQPAGPEDRVLEKPLDCRPCSLHGARTCVRGFECMLSITPDNVMRAVREMLPC